MNFGTIGICAAVAVVLLRITVGWHFFYEGCWKVDSKNEFSAIPFLGLAKGPAAVLFYDMLPDLDGKTRLMIQEKKDVPDLNDPKRMRTVKYFPTFEQGWVVFHDQFVKKYNLDKDQETEADKLLARYKWSAYNYAAEIEKEVEGYKEGYDRYIKNVAEGANEAEHQKKRNWDEMLKLRGEVNKWSGELSGYGSDFQMQLWYLLTPKQMELGKLPAIVYGNNKIFVTSSFLNINSWVDFLNFAVTWGLTAIGFCLIVGLCSRLAALGGAAFLVAVLLTQPPWPDIWPHVHPEVGHAMIVDKNFVEMIACLVLVLLPAGRWAGFDCYLWKLFGKKICAKYCKQIGDAETCGDVKP
ncbi:MAG: DoxX family protein [Planctomycetaceae bacterium]|nr:DoxX family protein [Planctomycetaceae bacterium]